jgi:hypothetical protein
MGTANYYEFKKMFTPSVEGEQKEHTPAEESPIIKQELKQSEDQVNTGLAETDGLIETTGLTETPIKTTGLTEKPSQFNTEMNGITARFQRIHISNGALFFIQVWRYIKLYLYKIAKIKLKIFLQLKRYLNYRENVTPTN